MEQGAERTGRICTSSLQMALVYRLDAISQGPKKSRFPGPNPLPLALVMDNARVKIITHRAV